MLLTSKNRIHLFNVIINLYVMSQWRQLSPAAGPSGRTVSRQDNEWLH